MPRHRKERVPPYRALRHAVNAARRVRLPAAVGAPAAGPTLESATPEEAAEPSATLPLPLTLESSTPAEAADVGATAPLPAFRRRLLQVASPAGPTAVGGATPLARALRRLMVTPWFAAATGIVVAAGLWVYAPHSELKFPSSVVGEVPCKSPGCGITQPKSHGAPDSTALLPITSAKSAGKLSTGGAARHLTFRYRVLWQSQGGFGMLISVSGRRIPRTWRLSFVLPGDHITGVEGAAWHPSGSYGGTASWPAPDAPWRQAGSTYGGDHNDGLTSDTPSASFLVFGVGAPVAPATCSFNGASCTFS